MILKVSPPPLKGICEKSKAFISESERERFSSSPLLALSNKFNSFIQDSESDKCYSPPPVFGFVKQLKDFIRESERLSLPPYCKRLSFHTGQEQACTRITRLFVRLFVCSSPCQKWPNTQENGCYCPLVVTSKVKLFFQTTQDEERGMNGPASLLHS